MFWPHLTMFSQYIGSIYKIEPLLNFTNKVCFAPTSYAKMFGSDERLIQFWLPLYPMLLFPLTPFKVIVQPLTEIGDCMELHFTYLMHKVKTSKDFLSKGDF